MPRKSSDVSGRAWRLLRLALLWARKGGVFKRRLVMEQLRLVPKFLKGLGHASTSTAHRHDHISHYQERELSFDDTPLFNVKMHRPASMRFLLPCITPEEVDFDYDFGDDEYDGVYDGCARTKSTCSATSSSSSRSSEEDEEEEEDQEEKKDYEGGYEGSDEKSPYYPVEELEGNNNSNNIDSKAEMFIANFYQQMKLQRQISYLEYTEMINRGAS